MTDRNAWVRDGFRRRQTNKVILLSLASLLILGSASWAQPMTEKTARAKSRGGSDAGLQTYYVAQKGSKTYHKISCLLAREIPLEERVTFHSEEEAIKLGYRKDRWCDPILQRRF